MNRVSLAAFAVAISLMFAGCGQTELRDETAETAADSPESRAKSAVRTFVTALQGGDRAAVLQVIDVPYFNHHRLELVDDRGELESRYDEMMTPWTASGPFPNSITAVRRYAETREGLRKTVQLLFDEVLTKDDFLVTLGHNPDKQRFILVRIKGNVAKVVGVTTQ